MTVPASIVTGAGLRAAYLYELDSTGQPIASSTTLYGGVLMQGAKVLTHSEAQPTRVPHIGDDRFLGYTQLPAREGSTAELRTGKKNLTLDALLRGQAVITVGESLFHGLATDKVGNEIQAAVLAYQSAEERDDTSANAGALRWSSLLIPRAQLSPQQGSFDDNAFESIYTITPQPVTKYPWGVAFAIGTEKYTVAEMLSGVHEGKPRLLAAKGDGTVTAFNFPTGVVAFSTSKIAVYKNGVVVSSGVTKAVGSVTFTVAPLTTDRIDVVLETL